MERCSWMCPWCGKGCGRVGGHSGAHQCPVHYKLLKKKRNGEYFGERSLDGAGKGKTHS